MEFYAAERKKELIPFVTAWMELETVLSSQGLECRRGSMVPKEVAHK